LHVGLAQPDFVVHHMRRDDLVLHLSEYRAQQVLEHGLSGQRKVFLVALARGRLPVLDSALQAALAVLKDRREFPAAIVPAKKQ